MKKSYAFTLVELLLCIAIIALLMTLTSPVITKAMQRAKSVGCGANLKKLAVAVNIAADDNDNRFPFIQPMANYGDVDYSGMAEYPEGTVTLSILDALSPYGITKRDLGCPADKTPIPAGMDYKLSYGWNPMISGESADTPKIYSRRGVFTGKLSRLKLFQDNDPVHNGGVNLIRADGSVLIR